MLNVKNINPQYLWKAEYITADPHSVQVCACWCRSLSHFWSHLCKHAQ